MPERYGGAAAAGIWKQGRINGVGRATAATFLKPRAWDEDSKSGGFMDREGLSVDAAIFCSDEAVNITVLLQLVSLTSLAAALV